MTIAKRERRGENRKAKKTWLIKPDPNPPLEPALQAVLRPGFLGPCWATGAADPARIALGGAETDVAIATTVGPVLVEPFPSRGIHVGLGNPHD